MRDIVRYCHLVCDELNSLGEDRTISNEEGELILKPWFHAKRPPLATAIAIKGRRVAARRAA